MVAAFRPPIASGGPGGETAPMTEEMTTDGGESARGRARAMVATLTDQEKLWCLDGDAPFMAGLTYLGEGGYHRSPFRAAHVERIGFDGFTFSDGPRGVVVDHATCFPVSMARGATWDPELEERIGDAIGREIRAVGADLFGGVCVNILRHPAWGRAQETYGEDPYHVGLMGAALTRGVQRHAMACVKHFACNSMENVRFQVDITVDEVALHEVYLPHFKRIIDEGAAVVMSAYNSVNGEWCGESRTLLNDILRDEWGFDGFVISDWIFGLRDAGRSLHAGLDVEMPYRMIRATHLEEALEAGQASWAEVDTAVERVMATRLCFDEVLSRPVPDRDVLANPEHRALAREAAASSMVLLRNEPVDGRSVLPLRMGAGSTLALLGELASAVNLGDGGSSDVWALTVVTPLAGLTAALPDATVLSDDGSDLERAAVTAAAADVALVVVGYTRADEGEFIGDSGTAHLRSLIPGPDDPELAARYHEQISRGRTIEAPPHVVPRTNGVGFATGGDRVSLHLKEHDVALIGAVAAANPHTVVAVVAGSTVVISEWDQSVPAIIQAWYSGMEGGHGLADVLLGRVDASGRLPFSVPAQAADLPDFDAASQAVTYDAWHGYWHLARNGVAPAYPFGFGLSYTTFELREATLDPERSDSLAQATVVNTGSRRGTDVLQVYGHRVDSDRPERLLGFQRYELEPGASDVIAITFDLDALAERDLSAHATVVRAGRYVLRLARHVEDPGLLEELDVEKDRTA
jgi:beta-glucosidase